MTTQRTTCDFLFVHGDNIGQHCGAAPIVVTRGRHARCSTHEHSTWPISSYTCQHVLVRKRVVCGRLTKFDDGICSAHRKYYANSGPLPKATPIDLTVNTTPEIHAALVHANAQVVDNPLGLWVSSLPPVEDPECTDKYDNIEYDQFGLVPPV